MSGGFADSGWLESERIFKFTLAVSLLAHAVFMASSVLTHFRSKPETRKTAMEIVYARLPLPAAQEKTRPVPVIKTVPPTIRTPGPKVLSSKAALPEALAKELSRRSSADQLPVSRQKAAAMDSLTGGKRFVAVPLLTSEKMDNPRYSNYTGLIRGKIRDRAYFYVDSPDFQPGEVYLTFVLLSNGALKAVRINDDKTRANDYLRSVSLRSIKESSPFPAFPSDLNYPELSFNVVISFQPSEE